ncbi:MAG: hypothetical protein AAF434_08810 [Pseudomonadota bacterium]
MLESTSEAQALEELHRLGCTDGLPVVVPTHERVDAMVTHVDLDPDLSLGEMGPRSGSATVEKVAASAVMAGCLPDHFPVVIAAVKALCQREFDLTEVNQTTHALAPLLMVNGPARRDCGHLNSGAGLLGPGCRANASIGRAVSLCLINIAGRVSGVTDLAVFSTPGKFTACFAEAEERSPFDPYHVSRGFDHDESIVTVIGVEAPHSFIVESVGDAKKDALRLIKAAASVIANPGNNHLYRAGEGGVVIVINPEHAQILAEAGYDRSAICRAVYSHATLAREKADEIYAGLNFVHENDRDELRALRDPSQIMLVVAGGVGTYSMVLPSWAYAPHGNLPVSEKIDVNPHCDLPFQ